MESKAYVMQSRSLIVLFALLIVAAITWLSASNVVGRQRGSGTAGQQGNHDVPPVTPPNGGEIKPAA
jgi:hypothetical protein